MQTFCGSPIFPWRRSCTNRWCASCAPPGGKPVASIPRWRCMKEGSGAVALAEERRVSTLAADEGEGEGGEGGGAAAAAAAAAASLGKSLAVSQVDAFDTTALLALTNAEGGGEEGEEERGFDPGLEELETRTPAALPPSTTISSTLEFSTILPPNFSIPRTRASIMDLEPPMG